MPRSSAPWSEQATRPAHDRVEVDYEDLEVLRSQIALAPDEAVGTAPRWMFERLDDVREQRRAQVFVIGFPPDMFGGLDPARVARSFPAPAALRGAIRKLQRLESTRLDRHRLRDTLLGEAGVRRA